MRNIHHNAIKYLTYLVLNKRILKIKQTPVPHTPPLTNWESIHYTPSPGPKRHNTLCCITNYCDQHQANGLTFTPVPSYGCYHSILFFCNNMGFDSWDSGVMSTIEEPYFIILHHLHHCVPHRSHVKCSVKSWFITRGFTTSPRPSHVQEVISYLKGLLNVKCSRIGVFHERSCCGTSPWKTRSIRRFFGFFFIPSAFAWWKIIPIDTHLIPTSPALIKEARFALDLLRGQGSQLNDARRWGLKEIHNWPTPTWLLCWFDVILVQRVLPLAMILTEMKRKKNGRINKHTLQSLQYHVCVF